MKDITDQLAALNKISSELEVSEPERRDLMHEVTAFTQHFIANLAEIPAYYPEKEGASLAIDDQKKSIQHLLETYKTEVVQSGIVAASGKHLGYIPGGGIFTAAVADFLAAVTNPYSGVYYASPGAVIIENEVINWLKRLFNFPENAVGNLASGGSTSTLIALTAARDKHGIKNEKIVNSVVYLSEQVHHSTQKALRIMGLGDVIIRYVPLDAHHKIQTEALEELITADKANGLHPFLVVATAGTTDTGAIDPLNEMANIAERHELWFHVDAAYGGFFMLTAKKELFKGIERADSIIVDPHKGMFIPYGLGAVLIKDKHSVLHTNHYAASYMQDTTEENLEDSPSNLSPELSKHFRGLRLWLPLQLHGTAPFIACLEEKILLVNYFRDKLVEKGFEVGPTPDLSVSYFWYPFTEDCNEKNKQLMDAIHADGRVFLSSSVIYDQYVIRIAILSFRTKLHTVDEALAMIGDCLGVVKQQELE